MNENDQYGVPAAGSANRNSDAEATGPLPIATDNRVQAQKQGERRGSGPGETWTASGQASWPQSAPSAPAGGTAPWQLAGSPQVGTAAAPSRGGPVTESPNSSDALVQTAKWKRVALLEAVVLALIAVVAAVLLIMSLIKPNLAEVAKDHGFETGSGDTSETVSITSYGILDSGELGSMLDDLGFPAATISRMQATRAMDGTLEAEGDGVNVTWTYHPDHGLQMVFEVE
jgi:hypothetical protein